MLTVRLEIEWCLVGGILGLFVLSVLVLPLPLALPFWFPFCVFAASVGRPCGGGALRTLALLFFLLVT